MRISAKMTSIGLVAFLGMAAIGGITWWSNDAAKRALTLSEERGDPSRPLHEMEAAQKELQLAAMVSIVDRADGLPTGEKLTAITDAVKILTDSADELVQLADTADEKATAEIVAANLPELADTVQVALLDLLEESGNLNVQTKADFARLSNTLHELGNAVEDALNAVDVSVRKRLEAVGGAGQVTAAVDVIGLLRAAHEKLLSDTMKSIEDKQRGTIPKEWMEVIEASIGVLETKTAELVAMAKTEEEKEPAAGMIAAVEQLDKVTRTDLVRLIEADAKDEATATVALINLTDTLLEQGKRYRDSLDALEDTLLARLSTIDTSRMTGALDVIGKMRFSYITLMLAATKSTMDRDAGKIADEEIVVIDQSVTLLAAKQQELVGLVAAGEESQVAESISGLIETLDQGIRTDLVTLIEETAVKAQQADQAISDIADRVGGLGETISGALETAHASVQKEQIEAAEALVGQMATSFWSTEISIGITLLVVLGFLLFVTRGIIGPLNQTVGALEAVAEGDYSQRLDIRSKDEIGRMAAALNTATDATGTGHAGGQGRRRARAAGSRPKRPSRNARPPRPSRSTQGRRGPNGNAKWPKPSANDRKRRPRRNANWQPRKPARPRSSATRSTACWKSSTRPPKAT